MVLIVKSKDIEKKKYVFSIHSHYKKRDLLYEMRVFIRQKLVKFSFTIRN